ncbi:hypothetical protein [Planktotalea sp.]|uniref:hypothetical protein n=1 Tax=Planktotalea sp. TaxID=2029877 RepID=UPI003F6AA7B2
MFFGFEPLEIALTFLALSALVFSFIQTRLRKVDAKVLEEMRVQDEVAHDHIEQPAVEEVVATSSQAAIEEMLSAIAAGANVLEEATKNGFSEDEARVAMASYDI